MIQQSKSGADDRSTVGVAGWSEFVEAVKTLPERLLDRLPADIRHDAQIQQEIGRLVLASLAGAAIETIAGDGDHPAFLPNQNFILNLPMPNADTIYRVARITPGGVYRLRGKIGSLRMLHLSQIGPDRSFIDVNDLHRDTDEQFDLILSAHRPEDYAGDWRPLSPATTKLLLRMVSSNWALERDPTISIERLDRPVRRARLSAAVLEQQLRALPQMIAFLPSMFVDRVAKLRDEGYLNKMKSVDLSQGGGISGQAYFDAAYELGEDDALLMEASPPESTDYFSLILGNEIHETTDWYNNHSSLNDSQCGIDADGILRVIVSTKDPGVPNWLDTCGYDRGLLQARWISAKPMLTPTLRKMKLRDVRDALPPDTPAMPPEEREKVIRTRRFQLQQRPLW